MIFKSHYVKPFFEYILDYKLFQVNLRVFVNMLSNFNVKALCISIAFNNGPIWQILLWLINIHELADSQKVRYIGFKFQYKQY